eukprot:TRINITY_DN38085_c0_g1_i1.p1 TRINITY_DN38085_c0_g1~~TRINITY_DN38085_c0_g1_i1.p1  ORF type:complete len:651 (+),score=150.30 TRINITY_DN38085_c0_g1_i1:144-2096(+)
MIAQPGGYMKRRAELKTLAGPLPAGFRAQEDLEDVDERPAAKDEPADARLFVGKDGDEKRSAFSGLFFRTAQNWPSYDDLHHVRTYLREEIYEATQSLRTTISATKAELKRDIAETLCKASEDYQAAEKKRLEAFCAQEDRDRLAFTNVEQQIQMIMQTLETLHNSLDVVALDLQSLQQRQQTTTQKLERSVEEVRAELHAAIAVRSATTQAQFQDQEAKLDAAVACLRSGLAECREASQADLHGELRNLQQLREGDEVLREEDRKAQAAVTARTEAMERQLASAMARSDAAFSSSAAAVAEQSAALDALRQDVDVGFTEIARKTSSLSASLAGVESLPNRRIEWSIPAAKQHQTEGKTWKSPSFQVMGVDNVHLEFEFSPWKVNGAVDCTLRLVCPEAGLRVTCSLFVNDISTRVQHSFDGSGACCTATFRGQLQADALSQLVAGVEVIEVCSLVEGARPKVQLHMSPGAEEQRQGEGSVTAHRYVLLRTLDDMTDEEQRLRADTALRAEKVDVETGFQKQRDQWQRSEARITKHQERLDALPAEFASFEVRWKEFQEEVRAVYNMQQERLLEALGVERQLVQMADSMRVDLTTALALKGRTPKLGPLVTPEKPSTPGGNGWRNPRKVPSAAVSPGTVVAAARGVATTG